jgi:hypothetical protein
MNIINFPGLSGIPSLILTAFALIIGGWYIVKAAKSSAETSAKDAQKSAIEAMQAELIVLRGRMEDDKKENSRKIQSVQRENSRLEHTLETLISALEKKGILITISGDMIDIEVKDNKKSTTIRIQDTNDEDAS